MWKLQPEVFFLYVQVFYFDTAAARLKDKGVSHSNQKKKKILDGLSGMKKKSEAPEESTNSVLANQALAALTQAKAFETLACQLGTDHAIENGYKVINSLGDSHSPNT